MVTKPFNWAFADKPRRLADSKCPRSCCQARKQTLQEAFLRRRRAAAEGRLRAETIHPRNPRPCWRIGCGRPGQGRRSRDSQGRRCHWYQQRPRLLPVRSSGTSSPANGPRTASRNATAHSAAPAQARSPAASSKASGCPASCGNTTLTVRNQKIVKLDTREQPAADPRRRSGPEWRLRRRFAKPTP